MKGNGSSERHQNNNLNVMIEIALFLGPNITFYDVNKKEQILSFLDTKIKDSSIDPEKRWITSWNHYLVRVKLFYRWLYNKDKEIDKDYWETPEFLKIKNKKTKRISPYVIVFVCYLLVASVILYILSFVKISQIGTTYKKLFYTIL
jgi:hypothetical protein